MGLRSFLLSLVLAKDRRTMESWLIAIELLSGVGGILLVVLLALIGFVNDILLVAKLGFFAVVLAIGLGFLALLQLMLAMEWNTRKKGR